MDKLPEPTFESDKNWPRKLLGVEEMYHNQYNKAKYYFLGLSALSLFRYYREITFYRKNYGVFLFLIIPAFLFTSYQLGKYLKVDPYVEAANLNNIKEEEYIQKYRSLWREAKKKNIEIPDNLIL